MGRWGGGGVLTIWFVSIENDVQFQFRRCLQRIEHVFVGTRELSHDVVLVLGREEDLIRCTLGDEKEIDVPRLVLDLTLGEAVVVLVVVVAVGAAGGCVVVFGVGGAVGVEVAGS